MKPLNQNTPTPYPELNSVLDVLVEYVRSVLGDLFVGAYLQGSFATGDFDIHSDVDFIIVIEHELSNQQVLMLQEVHEHLFRLESLWAQHLEGSYFPKDILRHCSQRGRKLWYLDNGARKLIEAEHCNTIVVRWVVRNMGVTLAGPPPITLVDDIPVEDLRKEILEVITGWGQKILSNPERYNNHFYQTFIVLSYCRMLHDLHTGYPGSKLAGAEWAKSNLDTKWSPLIDRTWEGRPVPEQSILRPANPEDFKATLEFVRFIIDESMKYAQQRM